MLVRAIVVLAVTAQRPRHLVVADVTVLDAHRRAGDLLHVELLHAPREVAADDRDDVGAVPRGGLELLQVEPKRAVAREERDGTVRVRELGPDCVRKAGPQMPEVPGPQERSRLANGVREMSPECGVAAVDADDRVVGAVSYTHLRAH